MKNIYLMDEHELRDALTDALLRWQDAEQTSAYYQEKAEELKKKLVAELCRPAAEAAEDANG